MPRTSEQVRMDALQIIHDNSGIKYTPLLGLLNVNAITINKILQFLKDNELITENMIMNHRHYSITQKGIAILQFWKQYKQMVIINGE